MFSLQLIPESDGALEDDLDANDTKSGNTILDLKIPHELAKCQRISATADKFAKMIKINIIQKSTIERGSLNS